MDYKPQTIFIHNNKNDLLDFISQPLFKNPKQIKRDGNIEVYYYEHYILTCHNIKDDLSILKDRSKRPSKYIVTNKVYQMMNHDAMQTLTNNLCTYGILGNREIEVV